MENNTDFDYYMILPIIKENTPLLMNDFDYDEDGMDFLYSDEPAPAGYVAHLQFNESTSNADFDVDYFYLDNVGVFSRRIKDVLEKIMPIKFFEFVPAIIKDDDGNEVEDFWIGNIYHEMYCFDENQSEYDGVTDTGRWEGIEKVVIDKAKLGKIPLDERLMFVARESSRFYLYHKSIIDILQSVNPKGMRFINVNDWGDDIYFDI